MAGRNDNALVAALQNIDQVMQPNPENEGARALETFHRNKPPTFEGQYDPDGARDWLKDIERIFRVMECSEARVVHFGTHMLEKEVDDWWVETRQRLTAAGVAITWGVFRREFLRMYFPEDVSERKEVEFLELKQGNMTVTKYASKFQELAKFYPDYAEATVEFSKSVKFENGLHPDIKRAIGYQQIRDFERLANSYCYTVN